LQDSNYNRPTAPLSKSVIIVHFSATVACVLY